MTVMNHIYSCYMVEEGLFSFFGSWRKFFFLSSVRSFSPWKICMRGIELFRLKHNFDEFIEASRATLRNAPTAKPLKSEI